MALGVLPASAPGLLVRRSELLTWADRTLERFPGAEALLADQGGQGGVLLFGIRSTAGWCRGGAAQIQSRSVRHLRHLHLRRLLRVHHCAWPVPEVAGARVRLDLYLRRPQRLTGWTAPEPADLYVPTADYERPLMHDERTVVERGQPGFGQTK